MLMLIKRILRRLVVSEHGPARILCGQNRGLRMYGLSAAHVFAQVEPHLQKIIADRVKPGMVAIDAGANIGYFSIMLSRAVGAAGSVLAFEPIPVTFGQLNQNLQANGIKNVRTFNVALSDNEGKLEFRYPYGGAMMASYHWHRNDAGVTTVTAEAIVPDRTAGLNNQRVDFVKIDVEGAEADVVRGMRQILAASRPIVFIECSQIGRAGAWSILRDLTYRCYLAMDGKTEITEFENYCHNDFLWLPQTPM
jgi:FkbM family methyltransferase